MKQFLAAFDGYKMSKSAQAYAIQLAKAADAHLIGVFLDEFFYHTYNSYEIMTTHKDYEKVFKKLSKEDEKKRDQAAHEFVDICEKEGISFSIHRDKNIAVQELKTESMFADLIIIDEFETFTKYHEASPTRFIKDFLGGTQCPGLVVPKKFAPIEEIVLLYDGTPSSLHAIKMFSYVLGNPENLPVEVFSVREKKKAGLHLPGHKLMKEFVNRHFPKATFTSTKGAPEEAIIKYLKSKKQCPIAVLGAYRRGEVSRWLRVSMADVLMEGLDIPLFIAHN